MAKAEPSKKIKDETNPETIARRNKLYQQYIVPFYNMIYKLCIKYSFSPNTVEENYNEVLINFYRRVETYNPEKSICTWLHICTKRQVYALERKRQAETIFPCNDNDVELLKGGFLYDEEDVTANVMGVDNYRTLYNDDILQLLDELKPIHRDAFIMQEAGYSLKEIAEIEYAKGALQSKNIDTVKSRLFFARQYLKKHLTREGKRISDKTNGESLSANSDKTNKPRL